MVLLGLLVFGAAEVAVAIEVAGLIGVLPMLAALIVVSALGPAIIRRVGIGVMAQTRARLDRGEPPTREVLDGLVVLVGGLLLCVPGFIGDAVGLLLMVGPVRHLAFRIAGRHLADRVRRADGPRWVVVDAGSRRPGPGGPVSGPPGIGPTAPDGGPPGGPEGPEGRGQEGPEGRGQEGPEGRGQEGRGPGGSRS